MGVMLLENMLKSILKERSTSCGLCRGYKNEEDYENRVDEIISG